MGEKRNFGTAETFIYVYLTLFALSYILFQIDRSMHPILGAVLALLIVFVVMSIYYSGVLDEKIEHFTK